MQLVINLSDYDLEYIRNMYDIPKDISVSIAEAILNGRKIPPHGRLGDLEMLYDEVNRADDYGASMSDVFRLILQAQTVIEADGEWDERYYF